MVIPWLPNVSKANCSGSQCLLRGFVVPHVISPKVHHLFRVLIAHVRDRNSWDDLQQVRRKSLEETAVSLLADTSLPAVDDTSIGLRVKIGSLSLETRTEEIDGVDDRSSKSSRECAHSAGGKVSWLDIRMIDWETCGFGIIGDEGLLAELERSKVKRGVWEHAAETHGESAVRGADKPLLVHLLGRLEDKLVATRSFLRYIALHAELECIERVNAQPM